VLTSSSGAKKKTQKPNGNSLHLVFERVWLDNGRIVAVRPKQGVRTILPATPNKNGCKSDV
jgi:hypothetical protein